MEVFHNIRYKLSYVRQSDLLAALVVSVLVLHKTAATQTQYCPFFNNRAPLPQPYLRNCTWFNKNCCCMQQEIDATFGKVKPLPGASPKCQRYLNYLMCYICSPFQFKFYKGERLTVCTEFCDELYDACNVAILKGSPVKKLYRNGQQLCRSRSFKVDGKVNNSCYYFDSSWDTDSSHVLRTNINFSFLVMYLSIILTYLCIQT